MQGAATRARISVVVPVAEKPRVEAKNDRVDDGGRERLEGSGISRPNSRRQWSRWHPGKRDATRLELVCGCICGSSYAAEYRGDFFFFFFWREERGRNRGTEKKPPGGMNDIIEFHAAPIPLSDRNFKVWQFAITRKRQHLIQRERERQKEMAPNFRGVSKFPRWLRRSRCIQIGFGGGLQTGVTRTSAPLTIQPGLHYTYTMCARNKRGDWIVFRMFRHWL